MLVFGMFLYFAVENYKIVYTKVFCIGLGFLLLRFALNNIRIRTMLSAKSEALS
jgi:hypothetical protein